MLYPCRKQEGRRERLQEIVGEKDGNKESYREKLAQLLSHNEKHDCFTTGATLSLRSYFSTLPLLSTFSYPCGEDDGKLFMAALASILHLGCLC